MSILITTQDRKMTVSVDSYYYVKVFEQKKIQCTQYLIKRLIQKKQKRYYI